MAALPPVPNTLKVEVIGGGAGATYANIFHVQYSGGAPTSAQLTTFLNQFATLYHTDIMQLMNNNWSLTTLKATDLSSTSSAFAETSSTLAGTHTPVAASTAATALVLSWSINQRYRGGHPRTYVPGQDGANFATARLWANAWITTAFGAASAFINDVNAMTAGAFGAYELGCVNYFVYGARPPQLRSAGVFKAYTGSTVHSRIDTQRRRLGKETT